MLLDHLRVETLAWVVFVHGVAFGDDRASNAWYGGFAKSFTHGVDFKALARNIPEAKLFQETTGIIPFEDGEDMIKIPIESIHYASSRLATIGTLRALNTAFWESGSVVRKTRVRCCIMRAQDSLFSNPYGTLLKGNRKWSTHLARMIVCPVVAGVKRAPLA